MNVSQVALSCETTRAPNKSSSNELCQALRSRRLAAMVRRVVLLEMECSPQHPPHSIAMLQ